MAILNIGILAHVDAGKTSLTERILYEAGVIRSVGRVDKGTTQTDTLELERARGITIQSAVVSFTLGDLKVNLIDTPGHGDFIAEVQRSLEVLDAVILVVSAVEGVQSQTRRLARAIRTAGLPLGIFINKIDRAGARHEALLDDIRSKLHLRLVPLNAPSGSGDRAAQVVAIDQHDPTWREALTDLLAESNEDVIDEYERTDGQIGDVFLHDELRRQIAATTIVPVHVGSAMTGVGVRELLDGIAAWFPTAPQDDAAPTSGTVFKIQRRGGGGGTGEKLVYVRLFTGSLAVRQRVLLRRRALSSVGAGSDDGVDGAMWDGVADTDDSFDVDTFEERLVAMERFHDGSAVRVDVAGAGEIVRLHGLRSARIGDRVGPADPQDRHLADAFPPPALETVVRPTDPAQITALRGALEQLSEQDPLIALQQRNAQGDISVRLYGEVQKEVLTDTLQQEHGIAVVFDASHIICIERPIGTGQHMEVMVTGENPFWATVGLRVEPGPVGSGLRYVQSLGMMPNAYYGVVREMVYRTLTQGLSGWEVTDCVVTVTHAHYKVPVSTGTDYRKLTPMVAMLALDMAGTQVCEPVETLEIEIPEDTFGNVYGALILARATVEHSSVVGATYHLTCEIPTAEVRAFEQQLPGLTRGEGGWSSHFSGYIPITDEPPIRERVGPDPRNRAHYLAEVSQW